MHYRKTEYSPGEILALLINGLLATGIFLGKLAVSLFIRLVRPRQRSKRIYRSMVRLVLELTGFGLLTKAAFEVSSIAGFAIAAVSCFVLAAHLGGEPAPEPLRG